MLVQLIPTNQMQRAVVAYHVQIKQQRMGGLELKLPLIAQKVGMLFLQD